MFAFLSSLLRGADPFDQQRFLRCIEMVENTPQRVVGLAGERSTYQITREVWHQHMTEPFEWASIDDYTGRSLARECVKRHGTWMENRLREVHLKLTPYDMALFYKAGYGRCLARRARPQDKDYAQRVKNLYFDRSW